MRLVFVYVRHSRASHFATIFPAEGYYWLLKRMVDTNIVDEVLVVIDGGRDQTFEYERGISGVVIPQLAGLPELLRADDVIWVRGGYKPWHNVLKPLAEQGYWLLNYPAGTGRERWLFWHVVFDDLRIADMSQVHIDRRDRFWFPFLKPTRPDVHFPKKVERVYDVCIGASHVYDKKCQWKMVKAAIEYKKLFKVNLKCILPGAHRHGTHSDFIMTDIAQNSLDINVCGMVPRDEVCNVLNQSKLFVHLGGNGQNDRGPLEAMACGTPVMIETPHRHAPFISANLDVNFVIKYGDDMEFLARQIHDILPTLTEEKREVVHRYHEAQSGVDGVILPRMKRLFSVFRRSPRADMDALREEYKL